MTVLVLTAPDDPTAEAVLSHLAVPAIRMDTGDFPTALRLGARNTGTRWSGFLRGDHRAIDLDDISAIYYRRPTRFRFPDSLSSGDATFADAEARFGFGGVLSSLDALWVNHPASVAVAEYKPRQLVVAARCGLAVPRTLITNDHAAAVDFAAEIGSRIVCKTLSGLLLADQSGMRMTFTTPVDAGAIDSAELGVTAHLLQEWVPKSFEVRVTVVGPAALGVAIHAESERGRRDWRSDYAALRYARIDVPPLIADGLRAFLTVFGLQFGAFDFVVTPNGEWIMLECNPAGQWLWLEQETGVPIAAALAELLASGG
jgi:ATP-grasp ribosomal peptide maturase